MVGIQVGENSIVNRYVGTQAVVAVYQGDTLIWPTGIWLPSDLDEDLFFWSLDVDNGGATSVEYY